MPCPIGRDADRFVKRLKDNGLRQAITALPLSSKSPTVHFQ
jgi:hypothetical protein